MDQDALGDVVSSAQVCSAHAAGFVAVSKAAFDNLAAPSQQTFPALASHTSPIGVGGVLGCRLTPPVAAAALGLGDVAANPQRLEAGEHGIAVVALVADDFAEIG